MGRLGFSRRETVRSVFGVNQGQTQRRLHRVTTSVNFEGCRWFCHYTSICCCILLQPEWLVSFTDPVFLSVYKLELHTLRRMERKGSFHRDVRRVMTRNYREQQKLEKLQKYIDKSKTLEMNRFQRSQMDTILRLCETQGVDVNELCEGELASGDEMTRRTETNNNSRSRTNSGISSSSENRENKDILRLVRRFSQSSLYSSCSATSRISTRSYLPEVQQILERKKQLERSRTWLQAGSSLPKKELVVTSNLASKTKETPKQGTVIEGTSSSLTEDCVFNGHGIPEEKTKEKPLHELLPPIQLPPLHLQKLPTLREQQDSREKKADYSNDEQCRDLEECRYLRPYLRHNCKIHKS